MVNDNWPLLNLEKWIKSKPNECQDRYNCLGWLETMVNDSWSNIKPKVTILIGVKIVIWDD